MRLPAFTTSLPKGWLLSLLGFGLLAAVTAFAWSSTSPDGSSLAWAEVGRRGYRDWLPWALVTPLLFILTARLPLFGDRWKLSVPAHLLVGAGIFVLCAWWGETGARELWPESFGPLWSQRGRRPPDRPRPQAETQRAGPPSPQAQRPPPSSSDAGRGPGRGGWRPPPSLYRNPFFAFSLWLPTYLALLGIAHALSFYRRSQVRERHSMELETGLAKARLEALRMQLQPHFLFNSLNAIAALIHKDPEAADEMVAALSDFLRLTLESSAEQELSLRRELLFVERYLAIEQVRFGERLQFTIDTPAETLQALVPTLVLQPLVENAVRHGLEPKVQGGRLTITARQVSDSLVLTVLDDGAGLHESMPPREGIGLVNTRARLRELYGKDAHLEMRNGDGVRVEITLPFHTIPIVA